MLRVCVIRLETLEDYLKNKHMPSIYSIHMCECPFFTHGQHIPHLYDNSTILFLSQTILRVTQNVRLCHASSLGYRVTFGFHTFSQTNLTLNLQNEGEKRLKKSHSLSCPIVASSCVAGGGGGEEALCWPLQWTNKASLTHLFSQYHSCYNKIQYCSCFNYISYHWNIIAVFSSFTSNMLYSLHHTLTCGGSHNRDTYQWLSYTHSHTLTHTLPTHALLNLI